MTKIYGYIVSGSRCKDGRFKKTLKEAKKEMDRQMRAGARESGIMEVTDKKTADKYSKKGKK